MGLEVNRDKSAVRPIKELGYPGFSFKGRGIVVSENSMAEFKYRLNPSLTFHSQKMAFLTDFSEKQ